MDHTKSAAPPAVEAAMSQPVLENTLPRPYKFQQDVVAINVPALRIDLKELIAGGAKELVLDLSRVKMVDSSGIGLVIATHNSLKKIGGSIQLTNVSPELQDLFRTMRMHQHFRIGGPEESKHE